MAVAVVSVGVLTASTLLGGENVTLKKTPLAWSFDEAVTQLRFNPDDPYLQFVVLQLGRNEGKTDAAVQAIQSLDRRRQRFRPAGREVDLFALFSGALAVQETLQLDTMRGDPEMDLNLADPRRNVVPVTSLQGPAVKSHPWGEMLAAQRISGQPPADSELVNCVPDDQYFVLFRSLTKLLETSDVGDLWGSHLFAQASKSAKTHGTTARLKQQLAVETDPLTRPFYDTFVDEVAITGGDLYFKEGSDVTVLFRVKQPQAFRLRMDAFLVAARQSRPDAVQSTGTIEGVEYVHVETPDRAINVYSAYPKPTLHVRSNSKAGLTGVLRAIAGKGDVKRLGETTEFKYIRTLMVPGDKREDGFVYLSDPFIRRLVGPEMKLTERRRMLCYNHLRMIGHAAMLYRTQHGQKPESVEQLVRARCLPGLDEKGKLPCPCGGKYSLADDGATAVCSHHGHANLLVPCREIPLENVTEQEAKLYRNFVAEYSRYWRRFFDPIAVRIQMSPQKYRAETIILPLIDNTIYSGMAATLGGEPEPLDALPVPPRNIFTVAMRVNKKQLVEKGLPMYGLFSEINRGRDLDHPSQQAIRTFLEKGVGNQIAVHVYDASPMFDFNLTGFLGEMIGSFGGGRNWVDNDFLPATFLIASLNSPVYISMPVKDPEVVDRFLDELDTTLAQLARSEPEGGWFRLDSDFYRVPLETKDERVRCYCVGMGPVKWRMFFARLDDGLYIASKRYILDDLAEAAKKKKGDGGPAAHGMVRIRPEHWDLVRPTFQLGWAESSRQACLDNLGPMSSVARAIRACGRDAIAAADIQRETDNLHSVHFFCPDGGQYEVSADGKEVRCSVHGAATAPKQLPAPSPKSPMGRLMRDFSGLTVELTFLQDGLHAVVTVDRK
jgi:hypothetical protein